LQRTLIPRGLLVLLIDIILATDQALDILPDQYFTVVVNYELPSRIEEYKQRILKLKRRGLSTSFFQKKDVRISKGLEKILAQNLLPIPRFLSFFAGYKLQTEIQNDADGAQFSLGFNSLSLSRKKSVSNGLNLSLSHFK